MKENKTFKFNIAAVFLAAAFIYGIIYSCLLDKVVYDSETESYILKAVVDTFYLPISLLCLATAITSMIDTKAFKIVAGCLVAVMAGIQFFLFGEYLYTWLYTSGLFYWIGYGVFSLIAGLGLVVLALMYFDVHFEKLKFIRKLWYIPLILIALKFVFNIVLLVIYEPIYGDVEGGSLTVNIWGPKTVDLLFLLGYTLMIIPFIQPTILYKPLSEGMYGYEYVQPQPANNPAPQQNVETQIVDRPTRRTTTRIDVDTTTPVQPTRTTSRTTKQINIEEPVQQQPRQTTRMTKQINVEQPMPQQKQYRQNQYMNNSTIHAAPNRQTASMNMYGMPQNRQTQSMGVPPYQRQARQTTSVSYNTYRQPVNKPVSEIQELQQRLMKLKGMLDAGLITQEDYERIKQQIMKI